eukprot:evm.model.NODE_14657_length_24266_cov_18.389475.7
MSSSFHSLLTTEACARPTTSKKRRPAPSQWDVLLLLLLLLLVVARVADEDEVVDGDEEGTAGHDVASLAAGVTSAADVFAPADEEEGTGRRKLCSAAISSRCAVTRYLSASFFKLHFTHCCVAPIAGATYPSPALPLLLLLLHPFKG